MFSYSALTGWATINSDELQTKDNMLQIDAINLQQLSLLIAIENVTCFIGNFACIAAVHFVGPKRSIHLCSIPLIVNKIKRIFGKLILNFGRFKWILDWRCINHLCTKCLLFVCIAAIFWYC